LTVNGNDLVAGGDFPFRRKAYIPAAFGLASRERLPFKNGKEISRFFPRGNELECERARPAMEFIQPGLEIRQGAFIHGGIPSFKAFGLLNHCH